VSRIIAVERMTHAGTTVVFRLSSGFAFVATIGHDPGESFEVHVALLELLAENERLREERLRVRLAVEELSKVVTP